MTGSSYVYAITGANRGLGFEFAKQVRPRIYIEIVTTVFKGTSLISPNEVAEVSISALKALDVQLLEAGHSVVATCRNPQRASVLSELADIHKDRLVIVPLDVNDEGSVQVCNARVSTSAHRHRLNLPGQLSSPDCVNQSRTEMWRSFASFL